MYTTMPPWEVIDDFLYDFAFGNVLWDGQTLFFLLLDENGNEINHPAYRPGGIAVDAFVQKDIMTEDLIFCITDDICVPNRAKRDLIIHSCCFTNVSGYRMIGLDFPKPQRVRNGHDFVLIPENYRVLSIGKAVYAVVRRLVAELKEARDG